MGVNYLCYVRDHAFKHRIDDWITCDTSCLCSCMYYMLADLYRVVLSVYQESESLPLPTMEEVLLCHDGTTSEDVSDVSCVIP